MCLALGIGIILSLISYHPTDLSWNTVGSDNQTLEPDRPGGRARLRPSSAIGGTRSIHRAVSCSRWGGSGFALNASMRKRETRGIGCAGARRMHRLLLGPQWRPFGGDVSAGGLVGTLAGDYLLANFNTMGAMLATAITLVISIYLVSSFSMAKLASWLAGPMAFLGGMANRLESWRDIRSRSDWSASASAPNKLGIAPKRKHESRPALRRHGTRAGDAPPTGGSLSRTPAARPHPPHFRPEGA